MALPLIGGYAAYAASPFAPASPMPGLLDSIRAAWRLEPLRMPGERPAHRSDIEGLRGIAVLLVVLYHAGVPGFGGGYVGVDVFFALSGYLITGILAAEIEQTGRLDFARFYARRARRLLPAMAVLLVAVAAFTYTAYAPQEQVPIARTALATAAYVSNLHFAADATDYLAAEAETNPLLHTWSLSVEEQFYLVWPILMLLAYTGSTRTHSRRLAWGMAALAAISFTLALYLMATLQTHWAFFGSPTRAWEFALGGLGAMLPRLRLAGDDEGRGAALLAWLGVAGVLAAGMLYTPTTPFPGWAALLPVAGTVLALRAGVGGTHGALGRVLAWRPLTEAGRLSYSWYLWHWPVLVFATSLYGEITLPARLGLMLGALVLAEASYRLVENPVRHHRGLARRSAYGIALLAVMTVGGVGLAVAWSRMAESASDSPQQRLFTAAAADRDARPGEPCISSIAEAGLTHCALGDTTSAEVVAVFGDSHAQQWLSAADAVGAARGWRVETVMKSACAPVDATRHYWQLGRAYTECDAWRADALDRIDDLAPDLILVSFATTSLSGVPRDEWEGGIGRVMARLAGTGATVLYLRDTPHPGFDAALCLAREAWRGRPLDAACRIEDPLGQGRALYGLVQSAARAHPGVQTASLSERVCPTAPCATMRGDSLLVYRDASHLTASFARSLAPDLARVLDAARATRMVAVRGGG
jgi:peptidoglycan/LPS O-acetylase OafA/YrhL